MRRVSPIKIGSINNGLFPGNQVGWAVDNNRQLPSSFNCSGIKVYETDLNSFGATKANGFTDLDIARMEELTARIVMCSLFFNKLSIDPEGNKPVIGVGYHRLVKDTQSTIQHQFSWIESAFGLPKVPPTYFYQVGNEKPLAACLIAIKKLIELGVIYRDDNFYFPTNQLLTHLTVH